MALSGSVSTNKYDGTIGLKLSWTGTQSIADNTTTIKWTLTSNGGSTGAWWYAAPITVVIAGKTVLSVTSRFKLYGGGKYKKTGSITVTHTEEGLRNVIMSVKAAIYSSSVNCTGTATFTLNKINRYALLSSVTGFTNESYPTIEYTNPAGSELVTDIKARILWKDINDQEQATDFVELGNESGSYTFDNTTLTAQNITDMLSACPDSNSLAVTFDLQSTMNETEYHHTKAATMTVVNADPIAPVVAISYQDTSNVTYAVTHDRSIIIQKQSCLVISAGEYQAQKGASLTANSYSVNFNGLNYMLDNNRNLELDKPDISGTYTATLTVIDTRGNTSTTTIDIPVLDWRKPTAEYSLARKNGFETDCDLEVTASISSLAGLNTVTISEKHRIINTPTWSQENPVPNNTPVVVALTNTNEWEMEISVSDAFATETYSASVGKGIPLFFFDVHRNSVSFNDIPDADNQFKVGGTLKLKPNDTDAGVILPHSYSTSEKIVGYWIDGSPIYEKTISYSTTISSGGNVTVPSNLWSQKAQPIDIVLYSTTTASKLVWRFVTAQVNTSGVLQIFNGRAATLTFDTFTIQYIKL